jgi:hypothetical protein
MSLGWSINVLAVNLDTWKRLDPKTQAFLLEQFKAVRRQDVGGRSRRRLAKADNCNTSKQPCTMGKLASTDHRGGEARRGRDAQEAGRRARCWQAGPSAAAPNAPRSGTTRSARRWA